MYGNILPKYEEAVESTKKLLEKHPLQTIALNYLIDPEGNPVKYFDDDSSFLNFKVFEHYKYYFLVEDRCILALLEESCKNKKLNSKILIKFLTENTWFGAKITKHLTNSQSTEYRWIDYISPSITSYFRKMNNFISRKGKFYPIFIEEIDSLTLKIEGMMRDLIDFSKIKGFSTIKHCYDNNNRKIVQKKNINAFLWDKNIFEIFPVDDVWFLRYLLIETINLRNDVAHCLFYSPKQYNIVVMHLVLIAILRLSKFNISINTGKPN